MENSNTDTVITLDDFAQQLITDHEEMSSRVEVLTKLIDKLLAERESFSDKVTMLESALAFSERKRGQAEGWIEADETDHAMAKLEQLGATS